MNFFEYKAVKVWFTDADVFVELQDGRKSSLPIQRFPLLAKAAKNELEKVEIIGGFALHWPSLGEDLSVAGFFENRDEMLARDEIQQGIKA